MTLKELRRVIKKGTYIQIKGPHGWIGGNVEDEDYDKWNDEDVAAAECFCDAIYITLEAK